MTEWLLGLVPVYGLYLLAGCAFFSCLAMPIPTSMLVLAAGGFVASGDLPLAGAVGATLTGVIAGDQTAYLVGRKGGAGLTTWLGQRAPPLARAMDLLSRRGGIAVFLSRCVFTPLGPYVSLAAGAARMVWPVFLVAGVAGDLIWVCMYLGLGYTFTGNLAAASAMALNVLGFLAAGALACGLGYWLFRAR